MEDEYTRTYYSLENVNKLFKWVGVGIEYSRAELPLGAMFNLINIQHKRITKLEEKLHDLLR